MNVTYTGAKQGNQSPFGGERSDSPESPLRSNAAKATQKTPNSIGNESSDNSSLDERYNTPNNKSAKKTSKPSGLKIKVER